MYTRTLGKCIGQLAAAALFVVAGTCQAVTLLGEAPDSELIVVLGGLEWVYAAPCAGEDPSCGVVQLHHDFQFANDAQWNASFGSIQDLVDAFTRENGSVRCASTYFSTAHDHCDMGDTQSGYIWHSPLAPDANHRDNSAAETFLVRGSNGSVSVPVPSTLALLGLGLLGAVGFRRRLSPNKHA